MYLLKLSWSGLILTGALALIIPYAACGSDGDRSSAMSKRFSPDESQLRHAAPPSQTSDLIKPGLSVGALQLGNTRERVIELLGKKREDEEYSYGEPCPRQEIHSLDLQTESNGVFVYLANGRVFQIESASRRYRTADGITQDSSSDDVRRRYPATQALVLANSGSKVNGGRDLIYWFDPNLGIAFELYYDQPTRKRRTSKIIVFSPGSSFQPGGCVSPPQQLRKLKPFATDEE